MYTFSLNLSKHVFVRALSTTPSSLVQITPNACSKIKAILSNNSLRLPNALRLSVTPGGCHGFRYTFSIDTINEHDRSTFVVTRKIPSDTHPLVIVDPASESLLKNCEIHFIEDLLHSRFVVKKNPQAVSQCGCGSSFDVHGS